MQRSVPAGCRLHTPLAESRAPGCAHRAVCTGLCTRVTQLQFSEAGVCALGDLGIGGAGRRAGRRRAARPGRVPRTLSLLPRCVHSSRPPAPDLNPSGQTAGESGHWGSAWENNPLEVRTDHKKLSVQTCACLCKAWELCSIILNPWNGDG